MAEQLVAVTHNGKFHADEVFATAVLTKLYPELEVVRSRDPDAMREAVLCTMLVVFTITRRAAMTITKTGH